MNKTRKTQYYISQEIGDMLIQYAIEKEPKVAMGIKSRNGKVEFGINLLKENAEKESFAEYLLNKFDCITSIEMAKNIAENVFEFGSPARDAVETLAQNYNECKNK